MSKPFDSIAEATSITCFGKRLALYIWGYSTYTHSPGHPNVIFTPEMDLMILLLKDRWLNGNTKVGNTKVM